MTDTFTIRGTFAGEFAECVWIDGMLQAPHDVALAVEEMIETRRTIERDIAIPWRETGAATMEDRWLAQATIIAALDAGSANVEDPELDRLAESWVPGRTY